MEQSYKKRPPRATTFCTPVLLDMGKLLYKSGKSVDFFLSLYLRHTFWNSIEKTAVICSAVFPEFLWLATGGLGQFNDRVKVLLGRQVIAFPDLGACDKWRKKAKDYPLLDITVSDYLEMNATPQQREMGADLADLVVEERS